ncbi:MAG TPA: hypothetical protein DEO82_00650 [Eubacterium sp.]|nr:hypothetical protein [Eubacterium sp.]
MADETELLYQEVNQYLDEYGIHTDFDTTVTLPEQLISSGYKEIDSDHIDTFGPVFQHIPGLAMHAIGSVGTYRVKYDKSLGNLQKSKKYKGFSTGNIVGDDGKITGQVGIKPNSSSTLIANGIFSFISSLTGQYFLSEINDKLSRLEKGIEGIQQFLETEKRSELIANDYFLRQVVSTFDYIKSNEYQKASTLLQLQSIRKDSYAHMNFYNSFYQQKNIEFNGLKGNIRKNVDKLIDIINEMGYKVSNYKFALYSYSLAYFLEIMLAENTESDYIRFVANDIKSNYARYKTLAFDCDSKVKDYFNSTKITDADIYKHMRDMGVGTLFGEAIMLPPGSARGSAGGAINGIALSSLRDSNITLGNSIDTNKQKMVQEIQKFDVFDQLLSNISRYDTIINNSTYEVVYSQDRAYIKCFEAEPIHN